MTFRLGLTGSIGMGKSTTAQMFADEGCAVWDADAAVARLYGPDGEATDKISEIWPDVVTSDGVDRAKLRDLIRSSEDILPRLEAIVHPLVRADRAAFSNLQTNILVFDIPLLFETGAETEMDAVACVSVPKEVQRQRVLARGTMSEADLTAILVRQMPNDEKCARADFVIQTDTLEHARAQVQTIVRSIRDRLNHA
ncbi:dephospho-CoA kinase [Primorskyibacter sp. S187A]|uniref:dephospho-CoA kinase n=1 Tax=Primorskyibacter sp. S187A TaxID=3415130 RepID=UPI003C7ED743